MARASKTKDVDGDGRTRWIDRHPQIGILMKGKFDTWVAAQGAKREEIEQALGGEIWGIVESSKDGDLAQYFTSKSYTVKVGASCSFFASLSSHAYE